MGWSKNVAKGLLVLFFVVFAACSGPDVSGNWSGVMELEGSKTLDISMNLNQEGEKVTGAVLIRQFGAQVPLTGTAKKDSIALATSLHDGVQMSFTGEINDNSQFSGKCEIMAKKSPGKIANTVASFNMDRQ